MTTVHLDAEVLQLGPAQGSRFQGAARRLSGPWVALRGVPHVATYAGLGLLLAGLALIVIAWQRTAALTNVGLQIPYLISAGCTGLALVAMGLAVINIAAKAEDARRRREQISELHHLLAELRQVVEPGA